VTPINGRLTVGLLYATLAALLTVTAFLRARHSRHDFADPPAHFYLREKLPAALPTVGMAGKRVLGRPFITAGWIVLGLGITVASIEIMLFVLLLTL
jgi:hypothetical protein